ncbi:PDZ domain-containing protein, partial [Candidatus Pelagibacter sp.]|nr:PDZ domain-containing protein [Candidatus Pelagibacter sp.]
MKTFLKFFFLVTLLNFNILYAETKQRPWIGIEFTDVTEEFIKLNNLDVKTPKNIIITGVVETSAADEANIIPGDVVISINNKTIKVKQDLIEILKTKYAGDVVNLKIYRQGNISTKNVKLKIFPDPGFKPLWVEGSKKLKNSKQKNYGLENVILVGDDTILYPKHFSKKVLSKYNHENLVVVCVQKGSDNTFKNYDQILSIEGQNPKKGYSLTDKPVQVKFKRGNKIFDKKITPTVFNTSLDIRHDCNPEFALYDCLIDYNAAWKLDKKNRGAAWRKTLKCLEKTSPVPFGDIFSKGKQPKISMKLDTITWTLGYLQYDAPDLKSKNNLNEINKILVFAKEQLKEFERFQKIYPGHLMSDSYDDLLNAITRATNWAAGSYSDDLKSTQNLTIKTDIETVKSIKSTLEKKINNTKIDSVETIKFLVSKSTYLKKANEIDYLIEKYEQVINVIDWKNKNLEKYFDNIYTNLSGYYLINKNIESGLNVISKGLAIALNNYKNLYFKSAYTELIGNQYGILMMYKPVDLIKDSKKFSKKIKKHLSDLDTLSKEDEERIIKIDKDSYFDNLIILQMLKLVGDMDDMTFYPLKMLDYIKSNREQNRDLDYAMALSFLLQAAIIEDDIKNFLYSRNEIAILYAESQGNPKKLNNLKTISTMLIQSYEATGFYSDSDMFINFISDNFTIDKQIKENPIERNSFIMYSFYRGISAIRSEN